MQANRLVYLIIFVLKQFDKSSNPKDYLMKAYKFFMAFMSISTPFLFNLSANAQTDRWRFGLEAGINYSNSSEKTDPLEKNCPILPTAGLIVNYSTTSSICLHSGLYYSMKGLRSEGSGDKGGMIIKNVKVTSYQHVIQAPILLGYRFNMGRSNLSFFAGPYFAYGIGGKTKAKGIVNGQDFEQESSTFGNGKILNRFDSGLNARAVFGIDRITVGLSYEHGLKDIGNRNIVGEELDYKNRVASLTAGYLF